MAELEQQGFRPSAWAHELEGALEGAVFPLSREELILVARENESSRTLLTLLHGIGQGEYHSRDEVLEAVERVPGGELEGG